MELAGRGDLQIGVTAVRLVSRLTKAFSFRTAATQTARRINSSMAPLNPRAAFFFC